jgi:hypothetical protein
MAATILAAVGASVALVRTLSRSIDGAKSGRGFSADHLLVVLE